MARAIPASQIVRIIPGIPGAQPGGTTVTPTPTPTPTPGETTGTANATSAASATSTASKLAAGSALATTVASGVSSSLRAAVGAALASTSAQAIAAVTKAAAGSAAAVATAQAVGVLVRQGVGASAAVTTAAGVAPAGTAYQPTPLADPTITGATGPGGAPVVGDVLTMGGDTWANASGTLTKTYQWYQGLNALSGQTSASITVTTAHIATGLRGMVTGTTGAGVPWTVFTPFTAYVRSAATATYDIGFGSKTRSGHGGFQVGVGRTISSGNSSGDWLIDDLGDLCPSGTFSAQKTYAASSYLLTLDNAQTVQITMIANRFDVSARYGSSANNDRSITFGTQCNYVLNNTGAGAVVRGDDIYTRSFRTLNPLCEDVRFEPLASYSGTGRIRVYGAPITYVTTDFISDNPTPIDFCACNFYNDYASSAVSALLGKNNVNVGSGIGVYDSTFGCGPSCANPDAIYAIKTRASGDCSRNVFTNVGAGIAANHKAGEDNGNYNDNIGYLLREDMIKGTWQGTSQQIMRNFVYNQPFYSGNHPDVISITGFSDGINHDMGTIDFNMAVRNVGTPGQPDFQGIWITNSTAPATMAGTRIRHHISMQTLANAIFVERTNSLEIQFNTVLFDWSIGDVGAGTAALIANGTPGAGGTIAKNVSNNDVAAAFSGQTGATITQNINLASTQVAYAAAFNAPATTGMTTRAAVLAAFTPKLNGTLKNGDSTYSGALLPPVTGNGSVGCWNLGESIFPLPTGQASATTTAQATGGALKPAVGAASAVGSAAGVSPVAGSGWNPSDCGNAARFNFSGTNNTTAARNATGSGSVTNVRGTQFRTTGRLYFTTSLTDAAFGDTDARVGVANSSANLNGFEGSANVAALNLSGNLSGNGGTLGTIAAKTDGFVYGWTIDLTTRKLWLKDDVNNVNLLGGDPDAGGAGLDISYLIGALAPWLQTTTNGDNSVINTVSAVSKPTSATFWG